ncbi:MAG: hypothetical protein JWP89_5515 [Schlesneria sp.]|nr:hypothetical protein [Schlesneria sp.]
MQANSIVIQILICYHASAAFAAIDFNHPSLNKGI